jgi:hypothetical protein
MTNSAYARVGSASAREEVQAVSGLKRREVARVTHVVEVHRVGGGDPAALQQLVEDRELRGGAVVERDPAKLLRDALCINRRGGLGREREDEAFSRCACANAGAIAIAASSAPSGSPR